ncbi:hypothetical protein KAR91_21760 [Candidatus Pacearchaeota archaeon]|nr:hypothetical protein [Candidatus Pacearchaeota archaeon]
MRRSLRNRIYWWFKLKWLRFRIWLRGGKLYTSVKSGDWSDPDTWDNEGYPGEGDDALITFGCGVILRGNNSCKELVLEQERVKES